MNSLFSFDETPSAKGACDTNPTEVRRGGNGPIQPQWDDVQTYSAEWYRRFRDWHHVKYPDSDPITRANLDDGVRRAEESESYGV